MIKKNPVKGTCRILRCNERTDSRGLCKDHCAYCRNHGLLKLYGTPVVNKLIKNMKLRKKFVKGKCRIFRCAKPADSLELCKSHYNHCRYHNTLKTFGGPPVNEKISNLKVKKKITTSICRIVDCYVKTNSRGLCTRHYAYCRANDLIDLYGAPTYRHEKTDLEIDPEVGPYQCRIIQEGKLCHRKICIRGLCHAHYNMFSRKGTLSKFALAPYTNGKRAIGVRDYDYDNIGGF